MKKKILIRSLSLIFCLILVFSTIVGAKEHKKPKSGSPRVYVIVPHPTEDEFPE